MLRVLQGRIGKMENFGIPIRKSLEMNMVNAYLNFAVPKTIPNFFELLPEKYQFADAPGHLEFCVAYSLEYSQGRFDEARDVYEDACRLGHPLANYCYGLWFLAGDRPGTEKDLRKAFQKFCVAHKAGLGHATYQLADFYRTGKGKVVNRDVKKSFAFLLQSILDRRIHYALDYVPYFLLGLSFGLGRGPSAVSYMEAARCFSKGANYAGIQERAGNTTASARHREYIRLYQFAVLVIQFDPEEAKKQVSTRLTAMEAMLATVPPARSMMGMTEFALLAKTFGLQYDNLPGKARKRVTWKSFRQQTDAHARALFSFERQSRVENWVQLEPDDEELHKFLVEIYEQLAPVQNDNDHSDDEYNEFIYMQNPSDEPDGLLPDNGLRGNEAEGGDIGETDFGAEVSNFLDEGVAAAADACKEGLRDSPMPKNDGYGLIDNGEVEKEKENIPKINGSKQE